ncbi:MAG: hypothetical protein MRJ93_04725 [Nitrososphaeraceae archaeon]|nr:hypothetical protein [Nitrososphaeraceae archaeon]
MEVVHSAPMSERYYNKTKVNKIDDNDNDKPESTIIYHLRQEIRQLKQQIREFESGLNPYLQDNQVQIIIEKQTWKRFRNYSKDNDSISEIINKLLDFYT